MHLLRIAALLACAALVAPVLADPSDLVPDPEQIEKDTSRKTVERDMKASATEVIDCGTLVTETRAACRDGILRGLKAGCYQKMVAIEMSRQQAEGNLFEVAGDNARVAVSTCRVHVRSLRRKRVKKDPEMRPADSAGPKCRAFADKVESSCLSKLGQPSFPPACKTAMMMFKMQSSRGLEAACEMGAQLTP